MNRIMQAINAKAKNYQSAALCGVIANAPEETDQSTSLQRTQLGLRTMATSDSWSNCQSEIKPEEVHILKWNPPREVEKPCSGILSLAQKMLSDVEPAGGRFPLKIAKSLIPGLD